MQPLTAHGIWELILEHIDLANKAIDELYAATAEHANAEDEYKRAQASAYIQCAAICGEDGKRKPVKQLEAEVLEFGEVADLRLAAHLKEGLVHAARLNVRLRTTQLSAAQSIAAAFRAEAGFERTRPQTDP